MHLSLIDLAIVVGYLILTIFIGYYLSKRASESMRSYFLGGNRIPWYLLGISNASGMFDITGTMWTVTILYVYGLKSVFLPWLWPVWNQVFLMIFLAVWMRRSNVMTGAEWLKTRFGDNRGSQLSHFVVVIFALVAVVGFIAYGFKGIGKFAQIFFEWDLSLRLGGLTIASENCYAMIIMGITTLYVVKGGMYSVVFTEVLQFCIMTVACIAVGVIAFSMVSAEQIAQAVPEGWDSLRFGQQLELDWSAILPAVNNRIEQDGYSLFSVLMMMMIFKGILVSIAGPVPGYDMQRILATETPRDAAKMSGIVSLVLFIPRYLMIAGLAVIALVYLREEFAGMGGEIDFEVILPYTIQNYIPKGVKGILLAGLVAAFMSTFAANVNAGPAYIVNDIYKKFINPTADQKTYMRASYLASFLVVVVGILFGFFAENINQVLNWIVGALFGGYIAANFLKWVWWRFNGYGYFYGMVSGLVFSGIIPFVFPNVQPIYIFPATFAFSFLTSVVASLLTPPEPDEVLLSFYESVRPWGFWKPVYQKLQAVKPGVQPNRDFKRDMFNCVVGIAWQMSLILIPVYLMIKNGWLFFWSIVAFAITTLVLYFNWYRHLKDHPDD
ncbi:sodium:solute symporter family protein [Planctomycetota bacterium]